MSIWKGKVRVTETHAPAEPSARLSARERIAGIDNILARLVSDGHGRTGAVDTWLDRRNAIRPAVVPGPVPVTPGRPS